MLKQSRKWRWLKAERLSFSLSQMAYIFSPVFPRMRWSVMNKSNPPLCVTECSLLTFITVPNFCDIIRMTVFPPRASFQRTYCVAIALISLGRREHTPNTTLTSSSTTAALRRLTDEASASPCTSRVSLLRSWFPFLSATYRPPDQRSQEPANLLFWKDTCFFLIYCLKCNFTELLNLNSDSELQHQISAEVKQAT